MYKKNAKYASIGEIGKGLVKKLTEQKINGYSEWELEALIQNLHDLNLAIFNGWNVWADTEKWPRNLDSGRHYFSIHYITDDHKRGTFWPHCSALAKFIGMTENNRDHSIPKWTFSSRAIGMSRLLDATDGLFKLLEDLTGTYVQL